MKSLKQLLLPKGDTLVAHEHRREMVDKIRQLLEEEQQERRNAPQEDRWHDSDEDSDEDDGPGHDGSGRASRRSG